MTKQRNLELDILKGFGILLMVFDHVGWGEAVHTYIQSFHMPLFFIVSGYLWRSGRTVHELAKQRAQTVLVPYSAFSSLYLALLAMARLLLLTDRQWLLAVRAVLEVLSFS